MMDETTRRQSGGSHARTIEQVREGMKVIDAAGEDLGTVSRVHMGDPEAVTTQGQEYGGGAMVTDPGIVGHVARGLVGDEREPDLPDPKRSQLLRLGYIKIDAPGLDLLGATDHYASGEQIQTVSGDTVRLAVRKDQLPAEV
jgi:hypothetical protein